MSTTSVMMLTTPMITVGTLVSAICAAACSTISWMWCERGMLTPMRCLSCDSPMMSAAADVNPESTGWLRKLVRKPILSTPMESCRTPTISARRTERLKYRAGSPPARGDTAAATSNDTIATGPTASCRELPNIAYNISGMTDAYRPMIGGRPASMA